MQVIILRGIPGAGKSFWIENLPEPERGLTDIICSADHFHEVSGVYKFDPSKQGAAHNACLSKFLFTLIDRPGNLDRLIVDNTNSALWELSPYVRLAEVMGIKPRIVRIHVGFETACRRNMHDVPPATIWRMHQNILTEKMPSHWTEEIVLGEES